MVSSVITQYQVGAFPWGIPQLQSDWSLSCDHGLDYATTGVPSIFTAVCTSNVNVQQSYE